MQVKLATVPL